MKKKISSMNQVLKELLIGILFFGICVQVFLLFLTAEKGFHSAGLWIGIATAAGMALHMQYAIDKALELGESGVQAYITKAYAIRTLAVMLVFGITVYFKIGGLFSCFFGIMSLKVAAYIQPFTHKFINKAKETNDSSTIV